MFSGPERMEWEYTHVRVHAGKQETYIPRPSQRTHTKMHVWVLNEGFTFYFFQFRIKSFLSLILLFLVILLIPFFHNLVEKIFYPKLAFLYLSPLLFIDPPRCFVITVNKLFFLFTFILLTGLSTKWQANIHCHVLLVTSSHVTCCVIMHNFFTLWTFKSSRC